MTDTIPPIPEELRGYIDEHLTKMEKHVKRMREALDAGNGQNLVDHFSAMQWEENSILAGCKQTMQRCNFTEKDMGIRGLSEYDRR